MFIWQMTIFNVNKMAIAFGETFKIIKSLLHRNTIRFGLIMHMDVAATVSIGYICKGGAYMHGCA